MRALTAGSVSVIDTASNTLIATVTGLSQPLNVAVNNDGTRAYVTDATDKKVYVIDASANTVVASPATGVNPSGIAVTPDGKVAYVMCSSSVTPIATATGKAGAPIKVPPDPWTLVIVADPAHS